jgi:hypothetical protein
MPEVIADKAEFVKVVQNLGGKCRSNQGAAL